MIFPIDRQGQNRKEGKCTFAPSLIKRFIKWPGRLDPDCNTCEHKECMHHRLNAERAGEKRYGMCLMPAKMEDVGRELTREAKVITTDELYKKEESNDG